MNPAEVALLGSLLEKAGIEFEVRNEFTNATYPITPFSPELWIIHDADLARAAELRADWRASPPASPSPRMCPRCGEELEGQFLSCWNCGTSQDDTTGMSLPRKSIQQTSVPATKRASQWAVWLVFALGSFALGSLWVACFYWNMSTVRAAARWPRAAAVVTRFEVQTTRYLKEGFCGTRVRHKEQVIFAFTYVVDGREYESQCFSFGRPSPGPGMARYCSAGYRFQARYNPNNPAEAVVEPGPIHYPLLAGGMVFLLWSAAGLGEILSRKR